MIKNIISYNVNGIRAAQNKGFNDWLQKENPDIICFQETKIQEGQIDPSIYSKFGYHHYWTYAEKKGYSGVSIFTKEKPDNVFIGMGIKKYDQEGRLIRIDMGAYSIIGVYIPSGSMGDNRQEFKMEFLDDFFNYLQNLKKTRPNLIVSGDYNICHKPIDINHPERHEGVSGFLPEEREWLDKFVANGFVDTFRKFNQQPNQYSWWSYRAGARPKNLGWRIDYHMVTESLSGKLKNASILSDIVHSDHCPVKVEIEL